MASLSEQLRSATAGAHERAEESRFVTELMAGASCRGAFAMLAVQHRAIYAALEAAIADQAADALVAPFVDPRLERLASLDADLAAMRRDPTIAAAGDELRVLPATEAYVALLESGRAPEVVLANHYVRYLGDLSGGQIVAAHLKRRYELEPSWLSFYRFDAIEDRNDYKVRYRERLDGLSLDDEQRTRLLAAAIESFELNQAVFVDLAAARPGSHPAADSG